jgi:MFS superfamily sulfate permease-like transporter
MSGVNMVLKEQDIQKIPFSTNLFQTAAGFVCGVIIYFSEKWTKRKFPTIPTLPICLIAFGSAFAGLRQLAPSHFNDDWLLSSEAFLPDSFYESWRHIAWSQISFELITLVFPLQLVVLVTTVITQLLVLRSLESQCGFELDMDTVCTNMGVVNLVNALMGVSQTFHSISMTRMVRELGATTFAPSAVTAMCVATFFLFPALYAHILTMPTFIMCAISVSLGLRMLISELVKAWGEITRVEFCVVLLHIGLALLISPVAAIAGGLALSAGLFIVAYSRISGVRHQGDAAQFHSHVIRHPLSRAVIDAHSNRVGVFQLSGFLFFGAADSIRKKLQRFIESHPAGHVKFVIFDFAGTAGIDTSVVLAMKTVQEKASAEGFQLILTQMPADLAHRLETSLSGRQPNSCFNREVLQIVGLHSSRGHAVGLTGEERPVLVFPTLDEAMEFCEDSLLATHHSAAALGAVGSAEQAPSPVIRESSFSSSVADILADVYVRAHTHARMHPHARTHAHTNPHTHTSCTDTHAHRHTRARTHIHAGTATWVRPSQAWESTCRGLFCQRTVLCSGKGKDLWDG